ncbi:MAG: M43 family zinc metalloprotease [Ferruginibacter sp.]
MKAIALITIIFIFSHAVHAQRLCGTEAYIRSLPNTVESSPSSPTGPARDTVPNEVLVIPVVIHVLYNPSEQNISTAQILSQLKVLNEDFRRRNGDANNTPAAFKSLAADAGITFCLAQVDPSGRSTSGIIRKSTTRTFFEMNDEMKFSKNGGDDAWDRSKYLNIWVCRMLSRSLGYATVPGSAADKDGIVINFDVFGTTGIVRSPFNKGRTTTHEVAHWLGLKHIWGDDSCGNDEVDDTPKQESYNFYCPVFPHRSSCSPNANGDMFMNFMDFTDDACMNLFTNGQKNKMRGSFALSKGRNSFLNSFACDSSLAVGGPLPDDITVVKRSISITVYPNPVVEVVRFLVNDSNSIAGCNVILFNAQGLKIYQQTMHSNTDVLKIKQLPAGVYFITLNKGELKMSFRIIKAR